MIQKSKHKYKYKSIHDILCLMPVREEPQIGGDPRRNAEAGYEVFSIEEGTSDPVAAAGAETLKRSRSSKFPDMTPRLCPSWR